MVGRTIDRAISAVAPAWGLRRLENRMRLEAASVLYESARPARGAFGATRASAPADESIIGSREALLGRARAAGRDTTQGAALRASIERNVVRQGITPRFMARTRGGRLARPFNRRALELWKAWAEDPKRCDIEGKLTFAGIQRRAAGEFFEAGEHFIVPSFRDDRRGPGLVLQAFEPEQLDLTATTNARTSNEIRAGVEIDEYGRAVAYYFRRRYSGQLRIVRDDPIRIPADRVLHIFNPQRVHQSHGVTRLAAVVSRIYQLGQYEHATMMAAVMSACIGLIRKDFQSGVGVGLSGPSGADSEDADGNQYVDFHPGMVVNGDFEAFTPNQPVAGFDAYVKHQARAIAAGANSSYEQLTRDFSQGTYSSQRQTMLEDFAEFDLLGSILVSNLCNPIAREFIGAAIYGGFVNAPGYQADPDRYHSVEWQGPARPWIDPKKEADAAAQELAQGITTPQRILNLRGHSLEETYDELAEARDMAEARGLNIAWIAGTAAAPAPAEDEPDPDEDEIEEDVDPDELEDREDAA